MSLNIAAKATALMFVGLLAGGALDAQQVRPASGIVTAVPRLVRISGAFHPANGSAAVALESATLSIYAEETGGYPLWQETQNVAVESDGRYSVLLGSTRNEGLPAELFATGEPRWLGVNFQRTGEAEQPRVLLASVPYALKAADSDTLGGLPASAYLRSDNVTGVSGVAQKSNSTALLPRISSGTTNNIAKFVNSTDLGNSVMFENAGKVGLGTSNPSDYLHVAFTNTTGQFTGYAVQNLGNTATSYSGMVFYDQNGALGQFQGFNNSTHEYRINNVASNGSINFMLGGSSKLLVRSDGDLDAPGSLRKGGMLFLHNLGTDNTGLGLSTLTVNEGVGNTALGEFSLQNNTTGNENTASGTQTLLHNTIGSFNTATGLQTMISNTTGSNNTAVGASALFYNTVGGSNTAIGAFAGNSLTTGSNNIMIANSGAIGDDSTIRVGDIQRRTFIAGIRGITTGANNAVPVVIDSNGQLGTISSSRRFKEDIQDMADASSDLLRLRPVTYRYKQPYSDGSKPLDYGLIAEEVAEVYPDLVVRNNDGQVETVQYQKLVPMMLNELQKTIRREQEENLKLEAKLAALESLLSTRLPSSDTAGQ